MNLFDRVLFKLLMLRYRAHCFFRYVSLRAYLEEMDTAERQLDKNEGFTRCMRYACSISAWNRWLLIAQIRWTMRGERRNGYLSPFTWRKELIEICRKRVQRKSLDQPESPQLADPA